MRSRSLTCWHRGPRPFGTGLVFPGPRASGATSSSQNQRCCTTPQSQPLLRFLSDVAPDSTSPNLFYTVNAPSHPFQKKFHLLLRQWQTHRVLTFLFVWVRTDYPRQQLGGDVSLLIYFSCINMPGLDYCCHGFFHFRWRVKF